MLWSFLLLGKRSWAQKLLLTSTALTSDWVLGAVHDWIERALRTENICRLPWMMSVSLRARNLSSAAWLGHSVPAPFWSRRDACRLGLLSGANERLSPQSTEALGLVSRNDADGTAVVVRLTSMLWLFPSTTRWGRPLNLTEGDDTCWWSGGWFYWLVLLVGNGRCDARVAHFLESAQRSPVYSHP